MDKYKKVTILIMSLSYTQDINMYTNDDFAESGGYRFVYVFDGSSNVMDGRCGLQCSGTDGKNVNIHYGDVDENDVIYKRPDYNTVGGCVYWRPVISYKFFPRDKGYGGYTISHDGMVLSAPISLNSTGSSYGPEYHLHDYFQVANFSGAGESIYGWNAFDGDYDDSDDSGTNRKRLPDRNLNNLTPPSSNTVAVYNYDSAFDNNISVDGLVEGLYITQLSVSYEGVDETYDSTNVPKFEVRYIDWLGNSQTLFDSTDVSFSEDGFFTYRHSGNTVKSDEILMRPFQMHELALWGRYSHGEQYPTIGGGVLGTLDSSVFAPTNGYDPDYSYWDGTSMITRSYSDYTGSDYGYIAQILSEMSVPQGQGHNNWLRFNNVYSCSDYNENHIAYAKYINGQTYFGRTAEHFNTVVSSARNGGLNVGTIYIYIPPTTHVESSQNDNVKISINNIKIAYYASTYATSCNTDTGARRCFAATFYNPLPKLHHRYKYTGGSEGGYVGGVFDTEGGISGGGSQVFPTSTTRMSVPRDTSTGYWCQDFSSSLQAIRQYTDGTDTGLYVTGYTYSTFMQVDVYQNTYTSQSFKYIGLNAFDGEQTCGLLGPATITVTPNDPNPPVLAVMDIKIDGISTSEKLMDPTPHSVSLTVKNESTESNLVVTNVCAVMCTATPAEYNEVLRMGYDGVSDASSYWANKSDMYRNMQNTDFELPLHSIVPVNDDSLLSYKSSLRMKNCFRHISSNSFLPNYSTRKTYLELRRYTENNANGAGDIIETGESATYELNLSANKDDKARYFDIIMTYYPYVGPDTIPNERYLAHISMDFDPNRYGYIQQGVIKPDGSYKYISEADGGVNNYINVGKEVFPIASTTKDAHWNLMVIDRATAIVKVLPYSFAKFIENKSASYYPVSASELCDCLDECISEKYSIISIGKSNEDYLQYNDYGNSDSGITDPPQQMGPLPYPILVDTNNVDSASESNVVKFTDTTHVPHGYQIFQGEVPGIPSLN